MLFRSRPLHFKVFDIAGRILFEKTSEGLAGLQQIKWDGLDSGGQRVAPGMYIAEVGILGDAKKEVQRECWID